MLYDKIDQKTKQNTMDSREDRRKILRVRATVQIGDVVEEVHTHDISESGLSLLLPFPSKVGTQAQIGFSLFQEGRLKTITLTAKAIHCTLSSDLFRTGYTYTGISPDHRKIVATYCNER